MSTQPPSDRHPSASRRAPRPGPAGLAWITDRHVLRAMLRAGRPVEDAGGRGIAWRTLSFDAGRLLEELLALVPPRERTGELERQLEALAGKLADRYRLQVAKVDDIVVPLAGRQVKVPRALVGEALGPLGADLFPTRRRARRLSIEAARELVYFGYGRLAEQVLPTPAALVRQAVAPDSDGEREPVLLEEEGTSGRRSWAVFELLSQDRYFQRRVNSRSELARLQQRLREDPLDGAMVTRLREFFSRRLTIGVRDTLRWTLGSRHPWFDWRRARELLDACFERYGAESFLSPRCSLYGWDVELPDEQLAELLAQNRHAVELFAERLAACLPPGLGLGRETLLQIAAAALDYHCDHPDFDIEAAGRQQGETTARFVGRAALGLLSNLAGWAPEPRHNVNFAAYFEELGLTDSLLGGLDGRQRTLVYQALRRQIRHFVSQGSNGRDGHGRTPGYHRPRFALYTLFEAADPHPAAGERVLDSFRLSELRLPKNVQHLRQHPDIVAKLVVFFTLVLRHYLDTDHVPDLRPEKLVRDFMLLGIWGYDTGNVSVNLYENEETGAVRSEVRFLGRTQVKRYRPEEDRFQEAALARKAVSHLGPLLEPSMLRALGNFLMAVEENSQGLRVRPGGRVHMVRHALEMFREAARGGLRATLVDLATALEVVVDDGVDAAQRALDRLDGMAGKKP